MPPEIAVIIPHYNDHARLERCLNALMQAPLDGVEVVVVDNGSTPPLGDLAGAFPKVRFVTEPTKGAAAARNRGVTETIAPHIAFLDADCVPADDWLAHARRVAAADTLIGGRIAVFDEGSGPRSGAQAFEAVFAFNQRAYVEEKGFSVTANLVTTRAVCDAVGPMIVGVSEDMDWCHRATALGFALRYDADLLVSHPSRADWPALRRKWRRLTEESFALARSAGQSRARWALQAVMMLPSIPAHLPRIFADKALRGPGERLRGGATLARLRLARAGWMLMQAAGGAAR